MSIKNLQGKPRWLARTDFLSSSGLPKAIQSNKLGELKEATTQFAHFENVGQMFWSQLFVINFYANLLHP